MNDLQAYLNKTDQRPTALAKVIGVAPSTITRLLSGDRQPSFKLALAIEKATGGKVTAKKLMAHRFEIAS